MDLFRYSSTDSNGIIPVGHQVAARTPKDKDKQEEWILARVLNYSAEKNK
jgi:SAGA-associated factor 29